MSAGQAGWVAVAMEVEKRKQGRAGAVRVAGDEEGEEEASAGVASLLEVDEVAASWVMGEGAVSCVVDEVAVSWAPEKPQVVGASATGLGLGWAACQCWCRWPLCRVHSEGGRSSRPLPGNADRLGMLGKRTAQWRTGKRTAQFKVIQGQAVHGSVISSWANVNRPSLQSLLPACMAGCSKLEVARWQTSVLLTSQFFLGSANEPDACFQLQKQ